MFDPYHKWLGIKPDQRPPTYYQLLAIAPDEQDAEVIEEAAIRQTAHIRTYQLGQHAAECTKILNELAVARTALLNPAKRKVYDAQLAEKQAAKAPPARNEAPESQLIAARPSALPLVDVQPADGDDEVDEDRPRARPRRNLDIQRKGGRNTGLIIGLSAAGGVLVVVIVVLGILLARSGDGNNQKVAKQEQKPKAEKKVAPDAPPGPGAPTRHFPRQGASATIVLFSPDGKRIVSGETNVARIWDTTGQVLHELRVPGPVVRSLAFSPDGRMVLMGGGSSFFHLGKRQTSNCVARLWDVESGQEIRRLEGHESPVACVAFSRDGRRALTATGHFFKNKDGGPLVYEDCLIKLWDVETGKELTRSEPLVGAPRALAFSSDGNRVYSCMSFPKIAIHEWDLQTGRQRYFAGSIPSFGDADFSPDGSSILMRSNNSSDLAVRLFKLEPFTEVFANRNIKNASAGLAISADGKLALVGTGKRQGNAPPVGCGAVLLDMKTGKELRTFGGYTSMMRAVAIAPDNRHIVLSDDAIHVLDLGAPIVP